MNAPSPLTPRLIIRDAARAVAWYQSALGAEVVERYAVPNGEIVHAALSIQGGMFSIIDENQAGGQSATALGSSPVLLHLSVADADAVGRRMLQHGAAEVIPIADRPYGKREGRIRDPFGHLWIVSQHLRDIPPDELTQMLNNEM